MHMHVHHGRLRGTVLVVFEVYEPSRLGLCNGRPAVNGAAHQLMTTGAACIRYHMV